MFEIRIGYDKLDVWFYERSSGAWDIKKFIKDSGGDYYAWKNHYISYILNLY